MSAILSHTVVGGQSGSVPVPMSFYPQHTSDVNRIADTRRRLGISTRTAAAAFQIPGERLQQLEHPKTDLLIGELHRWAGYFEVPIVDLIIVDDQPFKGVTDSRAHRMRLIKTVVALSPLIGETDPHLLNLIDAYDEAIPKFREDWIQYRDWLSARDNVAEVSPVSPATIKFEPPKVYTIKAQPKMLHRLANARKNQGLSERLVAKRLGISVGLLREQEQPDADLLISRLIQWREVLEVPLRDLFEEPIGESDSDIHSRAKLLFSEKILKSIESNSKRSRRVLRLTDLIRMTLGLMFADYATFTEHVSSMPAVGHRRSPSEVGRIGERSLPDSWFGCID